MIESLWLVVLTAAMSAGFTLGAAVLYVRRVLEPRLRAELAQSADALAHKIEQRVQAGVEAGIQSGIEKAATPDTLVRATKSATRTGASLVEDGLNVLLGTPPKRRP